jgi:AAA domain (dynein-related subfamily)
MEYKMKALYPSEIKDFIIDALLMKDIAYIAGPPGIGKSDIVAEIADEFNLKLLDIRLSQMLPEDLTGLPSLDAKTGKAEYNPFSTFPMVGDEIPKGYVGWLIFLDELSSSSEEIMAAIYSLLLGHTVGGKRVHPKALLVAAGNRASDSAIARALPDTLITRMLPVEMKVSPKDWGVWATGPRGGIADEVVDFISKYPDLLHSTVDATKRDELETFPTPRGWAKVSKQVKHHEKKSKANQITRKDSAGIPTGAGVVNATITPGILALMEAAVGVPAAKAFQEHYDESIALPYPWEVAQSPGSARLPASTIGKAKLTSDLVDFFIDNGDQTRDSLLTYMNRLGGEYSSLFTQMVSEKIGDTQSDRRLIENIKKRLKVDDLDPSKTNRPAADGDPPSENLLVPHDFDSFENWLKGKLSDDES